MKKQNLINKIPFFYFTLLKCIELIFFFIQMEIDGFNILSTNIFKRNNRDRNRHKSKRDIFISSKSLSITLATSISDIQGNRSCSIVMIVVCNFLPPFLSCFAFTNSNFIGIQPFITLYLLFIKTLEFNKRKYFVQNYWIDFLKNILIIHSEFYK